MSRKLRPMTVKNIDKWLRAGVPAKHLDRGSRDSVKGLMLDIRGKRAASWILRFQLNNSPTHHMGLGSAFDFTLAEARARAKRVRQQLADKIDPLVTRRAEQAAAKQAAVKRLTFEEAAQGWFEKSRAEWSSARNAKNIWDALAKWALPLIGKLDIAEIDTAAVLKVLNQPVENEGKLWNVRTTTASRLANDLRRIIDWATAAEHRPKGLPNPAAWDGHLSQLLAKPSKVTPVVNLPAMDFTAVPALMAKLETLEGIGAQALRFLIMTSGRINEVVNARHEELLDLDGDEPTWVVPASRMKARKEWRQPLAPQVVKLLKALPTEDNNPHVFIGSAPGEALSDSAIRMLLRRLGHDDVTVHGFRSSFSTWASQRTGHAPDTIEASLAHTVGSEVERAYKRNDMQAKRQEKRRKLMEDWARFVTSPPIVGSNVRSIRGAR